MFSGSVAIVGAGTAGLIAAKEAARRGIRAVVYDQKADPGRNIHASGILSLTGLDTIGFDYRGALTNTLSGANIHADGKVMEVRSKDAVAVVLDRARMNELCVADAAREGAEMRFGRRMDAHSIDALRRDGIVIGADGAVSSVARHFGMGGVPRYVLTYKEEYNVSVENPSVVDLFFDNRDFPGLFAWLCPNAKDVLEVGIGVDPSSGNSRAALDRFLARKEVAGLLRGSKRMGGGASMIPLARRRKIVDDSRNVMLVGDAAGQVKAMTGGGIIFGSNAARMAAEAASRKIASGESLDSYERAFMSKFGLEMKLHGLTNSLYSTLSPATLGRIIRASNALGFDRFLGTYGDMDRPSLVIKRFFLRSLAN